MRTIKFRGIDAPNDEWIYGSLVVVNDDLDQCVDAVYQAVSSFLKD